MPPGDIQLDTIALIEAVHRQDTEGVRAILDNTDCYKVAIFAARVCCDVIEDWLLPDEPDLFGKLRRHYS